MIKNKDEVFNFLNKNYLIKGNIIFDGFDNVAINGEAIVEDLKKVFSLDHILCRYLLLEWSLEKGISENDFKFDFYKFKDLTLYETQKNNRFLIRFPNDFKIEPFAIKRLKNNIVYRPLKGEFDNLEIEFYDLIGCKVSTSLLNYINNNDVIKPFSIYIDILDNIGNIIEVREFKYVKILSIDFSTLDYGNSDLSIIRMLISFGEFVVL